jgi:hypothetical protein
MGIGVGLMKDALQRVAQISKAVGSRALFVHALDQNAMAFYVKMGLSNSPRVPNTVSDRYNRVRRLLIPGALSPSKEDDPSARGAR